MALPAYYRLRSEKDFERVFREGKTVRGSFLLLKILESKLIYPRFGFIVPAKVVPKAVQRNAVRRILARIIQDNIPRLISAYDIVILVSRLPVKIEDFSSELSMLITKIH